MKPAFVQKTGSNEKEMLGSVIFQESTTYNMQLNFFSAKEVKKVADSKEEDMSNVHGLTIQKPLD